MFKTFRLLLHYSYKNSNVHLFRPATADVKTMIELFDAGMALARFNLSHGNLKVSVKDNLY